MHVDTKEVLSYSKLRDAMDVPYLLDSQVASFRRFLVHGIKDAFLDIFPVFSADETIKLEYVSHSLDLPKYSVKHCRLSGLTYASPLKVTFRLHVDNTVKEQEIYCGDIPIMIDSGSFVINGAERVIVSQLQRSPGISYEMRMLPGGKKSVLARMIPARGAWVEFEYDDKGLLYASVDRRRKLLITTFLKALFFKSNEEILQSFYDEELVSPGQLTMDHNGRVVMQPVVDQDGEVLADTLDVLHHGLIDLINERKAEVSLVVSSEEEALILKTLVQHSELTEEEAVLELFKRLRPGDPIHTQNVVNFVKKMFFDDKRYNLSQVGRFRANIKLGMNKDLDKVLLDKEDIVHVIKHLLAVRSGTETIDDIDHLGRRRVILVGEQVAEQFRMGLLKVERLVRERMTMSSGTENLVPHSYLNSKIFSTAIKDYFQRDSLSQFMDAVNPIASLTHKRRLSALGRRGLNRDRAGFEVRDVHHSHYGRICPIETPEGPNIGLISSLALYSRINHYGFIETPYREVKEGRVTDTIRYLSADEEDKYRIVHANTEVDETGTILGDKVVCRSADDYESVAPQDIDFMDVSTKQIFSNAAALIPFLEHNDANRALMGSNMQRQAVPLLRTEAPVVGTGVESFVARDAEVAVFASSDGVVTYVDSERLIFSGEMGEEEFVFDKYLRSNSGTCLNQNPVVSMGQKVKKGDILIDGQSTEFGRLALGRNITVGFLPWRGYNFEDAIVVNERIVREGVYSSVRIEEFTVEARDTKLGEEEITRDIPNVPESSLVSLDDDGIVKEGVFVKQGDILVGKISPTAKADLQLTGINPEEKLLRALFGEKNMSDFRNVSLKMPSGLEGVVVGRHVFSKKVFNSDKTEEVKDKAKEIEKVYATRSKKILKLIEKKLAFLVGKSFAEDVFDVSTGNCLLKAGEMIDKKIVSRFHEVDYALLSVVDDPEGTKLLKEFMDVQTHNLKVYHNTKELEVTKLYHGDELAPSVLKVVKVYVACKRRLSVGDKMAGRHGNKGVVSVIVPEEDMPFLPDGTQLDILLNPLGVPSRMNIGQVLEIHMGWAAKVMGKRVVTPVFDGASVEDVKNLMKDALHNYSEEKWCNENNFNLLRDGYTGKFFEQSVNFGVLYMLKLNHLVDDKKHARSTGPYSLVTQQPLGGKAQFGGQRFGEMEVWALEAYGAAYTLQEILTVKSDDVTGRNRIYQDIVKNRNSLGNSVGGPESFNVLVKELQSLCLDVRFGKSKK